MTKPAHPEAEGVIQFQLDFQAAPALDWSLCAELDAWRGLLFHLGLTGQDPERYGGLAYGNVSRRLDAQRFLISGTQTGGLASLGPEHYGVVDACDSERNRITAHGPIRPSSEALTHGAVYQTAAGYQCVLHVHSPLIWNQAAALGLAMTPPKVTYGTPAMAAAVAALMHDGQPRVIAMGGHRDGLIAAGATCETAALPLLRALALALQREQAKAQ